MDNNYSLADLSAAMGGNGGNQFNNPIWLIWALLFGFGGNGYGFGRNGAGQGLQDAEIMGQLNAIRQTMADNQNANALGAAIGSNHDFLHNLAGQMNMGFAGTNATINAASTGNLLGQKDLQSGMQSCCCDIKSSILNQTNQLQNQVSQLANGVQTGFANLGFLTQQQTTDLNAAATANTQRILDHLCAAETQALRDKLLQASQDAQTASIVAQLKTTA